MYLVSFCSRHVRTNFHQLLTIHVIVVLSSGHGYGDVGPFNNHKFLYNFVACYGVKFLPDGPQNWQCSRCSSEEPHRAECALCSLRGGALKPTENGRWAHIVCAIANTEVTFKSVSQREPVDISNISRPRATLVSGSLMQCLQWCLIVRQLKVWFYFVSMELLILVSFDDCSFQGSFLCCIWAFIILLCPGIYAHEYKYL